jgi:hypothetical protein
MLLTSPTQVNGSETEATVSGVAAIKVARRGRPVIDRVLPPANDK